MFNPTFVWFKISDKRKKNQNIITREGTFSDLSNDFVKERLEKVL